MKERILAVLLTISRLLTFELTRKEFSELNRDHLVIGIICTWLAGIGRSYHNPEAEWWQLIGLGSVAYIFALATFLWLILLPVHIRKLSWVHLLTFLALVSPTGFIYAIPVELFLSPEETSTVRLWFLGIVAGWRVALLAFYLRRHCRLRCFIMFISCAFPLSVIVTVLSLLYLNVVVFDSMRAAIRAAHSPGVELPPEPRGNSSAYYILSLVTLLSVLSFIPLLISYVSIVIHRRLGTFRAGESPGRDKAG